MFLILLLKNFFLLQYNLTNLLKQIKKKKSLKKIFLFVLFYIFLNLFLIPNFALCEIDYELLDRKNNTYKGSKIFSETPQGIITEEDIKYAQGVCRTVAKISAIGFVISLTLYIYLMIN